MRSRLFDPVVSLVGAVVVGAVMGVVGWSFLEVLLWATHTREDHGWLLFLLPAAGFAVGWTYHRWGGAASGGTPLVARQVLRRTEDIPARMAPMIYAGTAVGHLFGASVGREGAAVQMSASITDSAARALGLSERSRQVLLPASVAAAFGSLLGTPLAGVVVAVSLQRRVRPLVVVCSLLAGLVANRIVIAFGYERETAPALFSVDWSMRWVAALVVVGLVCGVAARLFDLSMHRLRSLVTRLVVWPPLRPVVGGTATVVLALLVGRDYLGLSVPLIGDAFNGDAGWVEAAWKLVFTVIALATGFVGGEMVPLFVVGSALGAAVGAMFGVPVGVLVAVGFVTVFSAATTLTMFGIVAAVELFGWATLAPAVIAGLVARAIAGRPGVYLTTADLEQAREEL
jgi:H+/Cl- antiporter ClcA